MGLARLLFLADTHLGFDLPFRPRIQRRRRGPEFFANFQRALQPALDGEVDCVVHGGDLLFRSKVPPRLVAMAFEPLKRVSDQGIPVYLVPGNHERSAIPHSHLAEHPRIHMFDRPRTYKLQTPKFTLALAGFPFVRHAIRKDFLTLLDQTGWHQAQADVHVLCLHQAIDGARVGPSGYQFRYAPDVVRASDIPPGFAAILCGHIHRFQVLAKDLRRKALPAPVFYAGSIERTSFAERREKKGYVILEFATHGPEAGILTQWTFHQLPARPMIQLDLHAAAMSGPQLKSWIQTTTQGLPEDSIVKLKVHGRIPQQAIAVLNAASLRALAPPTMNINAVFVDEPFYPRRNRL